ncbi:MAG: M20/M25/M40 family metallo-hydrolase [Chloroflexi bacterium]|nr:M20/M25/M40 family metallo-hydrolase [Chloroflexota bacterium]
MISSQRVREITLDLVRFPSITETDGESHFAEHIAALLREWPYFQRHAEHIRIVRTRDDFRERSNVYALVRGRGARTVLLTGHYDVVSAANYGVLEPLAFDPLHLLPALIEATAGANDAASRQAHTDLSSGDFLPGRGALDMKAGLAIGMAVLEEFAADLEREGNLLFVCTPDEENYSHGMRSAARDMPALLREFGLEPTLAVNLDAAVNSGDGADGRAIFMGSVSKLLPFVHFVGRPAHVGAPFDGVNAALLAAEFVREVESNPAWGDAAPTQGEVPPPPVFLRAVDLKHHYDVTMPEQAFTALNVLTYSDGPDEVLARVRRAAECALQSAHALLRVRAQAAGAPFGVDAGEVIEFGELLWRAGPAAEQEIAALADDRTFDVLRIAERAVQIALRYARVSGLVAVTGFAPVYYPLAALQPEHEALRARLVACADSIEADTGYAIALRPFFTGISDMSFLGATIDADALAALRVNMPAWRVRWPIGAAAASALAVINIGPWGRDYHQRTERVHEPYSFGVVPELLWRVVRAELE